MKKNKNHLTNILINSMERKERHQGKNLKRDSKHLS